MSREPAVRRNVPSERRRNARSSSRHNSRRSLFPPEQIPSEKFEAADAAGSHDIQPHRTKLHRIQSCWHSQLKSNLWQFARHPATLLIAAWIICVGIAGFAAQEMIRVTPIARQDKSAQPNNAVQSSTHSLNSQQSKRLQGTDNNRRTTKENSEDLPLTSLLAVAISCAAGSFILFHRPAQRKPDRRLHLSSRHRTPSASLPVATEPLSIQSAETPIPVRATLVPEEESHPLDWDEPSLADNLDLRQQRPLSHWL